MFRGEVGFDMTMAREVANPVLAIKRELIAILKSINICDTSLWSSFSGPLSSARVIDNVSNRGLTGRVDSASIALSKNAAETGFFCDGQEYITLYDLFKAHMRGVRAVTRDSVHEAVAAIVIELRKAVSPDDLFLKLFDKVSTLATVEAQQVQVEKMRSEPETEEMVRQMETEIKESLRELREFLRTYRPSASVVAGFAEERLLSSAAPLARTGRGSVQTDDEFAVEAETSSDQIKRWEVWSNRADTKYLAMRAELGHF